jgi:hypothetical protein
MDNYLKPMRKRDVDSMNQQMDGLCKLLQNDEQLQKYNDTQDMIVDNFICGYKTSKRNHPINWFLRTNFDIDVNKYCKNNPEYCNMIEQNMDNICRNKVDFSKARDLACRTKFRTTCQAGDDDTCGNEYDDAMKNAMQLNYQEMANCNSNKNTTDLPFQKHARETICDDKFLKKYFNTHSNIDIDEIYYAAPWLKATKNIMCNAKSPSCEFRNPNAFYYNAFM